MLVKEKGKIVKSVGVKKSLQEREHYKHLGILEADRFLGQEMKLKVSKKYFRRLKKVLRSQVEWWEFSPRSQYLASVPFKILSSVY